MENEQYERLENLLLDIAQNDELKVVSELQTEDYVDSKTGHKRHIQRVKQTDKPNVPLILRLLDQRIGGPQDWC